MGGGEDERTPCMSPNNEEQVPEMKRELEASCSSVCGTRSSMLAGLSCTKGVWYIYDWDTGSTILIW